MNLHSCIKHANRTTSLIYRYFHHVDRARTFLHLIPLSAANTSLLQSGRFSSPIREIFHITNNLMDKKFPESGSLSNLCIWIGLFYLKIRKSSAESGRVGSSAELYEEANIFKLHIFGVEITICSFLHISKSNLRIKEWDYVRKISMRR